MTLLKKALLVLAIIALSLAGLVTSIFCLETLYFMVRYLPFIAGASFILPLVGLVLSAIIARFSFKKSVFIFKRLRYAESQR